MDLSRRSLLREGAGAAALAIGGFAGCTNALEAAEPGVDSGYAAFFTLWDWANAVGGDAVEFENPVEAGRMGHGWEPDGDVAREIAGSDAFVYLDTPEFSWAQNVAATLETDYDGVVVIDGMEPLGSHLLAWDGHRDGHDDHEDDQEHEHGGGAGGDRAFADPHVWVDPVLAREIVDTIAAGLADADPERAETFRDNAAAYGGRLADLDEAYRDLVATADREVAVLAGHDSFRYVQARYGFEFHTPAGVSPNDAPSQEDIADTIEVVDDHGIDTVLYDPFDAPDGSAPALAETVVENSGATATAPITSAEGTTADWLDRGWGYVEQIEEVTLPALGAALGAEAT